MPMSPRVGAVELGNPEYPPWHGVRSGLASIMMVGGYERCGGRTHNVLVGRTDQPQIVKHVAGDFGRIGDGPGINESDRVEKLTHYRDCVAAANDAYVVHRILHRVSQQRAYRAPADMAALFAARAPALVSALRFRAEKDAALHWSNWATTSAGK